MLKVGLCFRLYTCRPQLTILEDRWMDYIQIRRQDIALHSALYVVSKMYRIKLFLDLNILPLIDVICSARLDITDPDNAETRPLQFKL